MGADDATPTHLDLKKDTGLAITWSDGRASFYPIGYLRRMSPSAEMRELRKAMKTNPLAVLPKSPGSGTGQGGITAAGAELVGNYAIKILFSDGHDTGIYSWSYLREIDPDTAGDGPTKSDRGPSHNNPLGL